MKTKLDQQSVQEQWQAAQIALNDAQKLPGGPERIEALKRAGRLRYQADQRRRSVEEEIDRNKKLARTGSEDRN
jgi:hypothetical protein